MYCLLFVCLLLTESLNQPHRRARHTKDTKGYRPERTSIHCAPNGIGRCHHDQEICFHVMGIGAPRPKVKQKNKKVSPPFFPLLPFRSMLHPRATNPTGEALWPPIRGARLG